MNAHQPRTLGTAVRSPGSTVPSASGEPTRQRPSGRGAWASLAAWPQRRWWVALLGGAATVLVVGLPTAMIPNPVFGREIPTTGWAWPVLAATAVLGGLLGATYVRGAGDEAGSRAGVAGGLLAYFAVGCPVCNKLALLALGYAGALQWFAPIQPWLAAGGVLLLGYALDRRLRGEVACPVRPESAT